MKPSWWRDFEPIAHRRLDKFTSRLKDKLSVDPEKIVLKKNPFLFRMRVGSDPEEYAKKIVDAYLSSSEETMFGNVLEDLAVQICMHAKQGIKSSASNIDLEYMQENTRTIVQIKSGVNWGNSSQHKALRESFMQAQRILRQGNRDLQIRCIEGCCYGKSEIKDQGTHYRYVGQKFWEEISDWEGTATAVIELMGIHSSNGLEDARRQACDRIVSYLEDNYAIEILGPSHEIPEQIEQSDARPGRRMRWDGLLNLVLGLTDR